MRERQVSWLTTRPLRGRRPASRRSGHAFSRELFPAAHSASELSFAEHAVRVVHSCGHSPGILLKRFELAVPTANAAAVEVTGFPLTPDLSAGTLRGELLETMVRRQGVNDKRR